MAGPDNGMCGHFIRRSECIYCGPLAAKPMSVLWCEPCAANRWHVVITDEEGVASCCGCGRRRTTAPRKEDIGIAKD